MSRPNVTLRGVFDRVDIVGSHHQHNYFGNNPTLECCEPIKQLEDNNSNTAPKHIWITDFKSNVGAKRPEAMVRCRNQEFSTLSASKGT